LLALLLSACPIGPIGPERACRDTLKTGCKQLKRCDRASFERSFDSVSDCVDQAERLISCDGLTKGDVCSNADDYNGWKASACIRALRGQECNDSSTPPACDEICGG
jgi:hypothetical protein